MFATPTWVSGALRMPRNAFATIVSTCVATLGAYGIGTAVLRQLPARRGKIALAVAAIDSDRGPSPSSLTSKRREKK